MSKTNEATIIGGTLLIAGTSIGGGMLALPIATGAAGFWPAMFINTCCWLFMMATGLLFLEATLWMHEGANVLSMAKRFLGRSGEVVAGLTFLFLYYCLQVSYIAGGAPLFGELLNLSVFLSYFFYVLVFGSLVFLGTRAVDRINWLLMTGAILSYIILISLGSSKVQDQLLSRANWKVCLFAAPILFSAYGYHNIVPTLTFYMNRNVNKMRLAIIFGTLLPFVVYSIWQWLILGTIPADLLQQDIVVTKALGDSWIALVGNYFALFAIVTSLLGVSLSMVDFLGDGLNMPREGGYRLFLCSLVFIPPLFFAIKNPTIFNEAMGYAGGYGEAILNGLFPVALVWIGRYRMKLPTKELIPGGRPMLLLLAAISLLIIGLETYHLLLH